jgi:hypothetical protein
MAALRLAGTSQHYRGLYQSVSSARPLDNRLLDELQGGFPEVVELPPLAEAMVAIDDTHEHMQQIAAAGWQTPAGHPDLQPAHEALLLREHFAELLRSEEVQSQPAAFQQMLRDSVSAAAEVEATLRDWQLAAKKDVPSESLQRSFDRVSSNCKSCHEQFRDVPLSEKR